MPSHRKDRGCGRRKPIRAERIRVIAGVGRAGKRKSTEVRENGNRQLLNKAIEDLEAYITEYRNWDWQRDGQMLATLVDNKQILESVRDNSPRITSILVRTVLNHVRYSLYECFDRVQREQEEDALVKSISGLQLLQG